jgi:cytochrome c biogenesis protein CcmG, thiol:disulfide interchange protein DsbE
MPSSLPAGFKLLALLMLALATGVRAAPSLDDLTPRPDVPTYVDFWASWCVPCALSFPWINAMQDRYGDRMHFVGVNVDRHRSDAARFLQRYPAQFTLLFDAEGTLAAHFDLEGMPSAVILDSQGQVLWQHSGFRPAETGDYERAILEALSP